MDASSVDVFKTGAFCRYTRLFVSILDYHKLHCPGYDANSGFRRKGQHEDWPLGAVFRCPAAPRSKQPVRGFDSPMMAVHPDSGEPSRWLVSQLQVQLNIAQAREGNHADNFDVECLKEAYPWKGHEGICDEDLGPSSASGWNATAFQRATRLGCTDKKDAQTPDDMVTTAEVCIPSEQSISQEWGV